MIPLSTLAMLLAILIVTLTILAGTGFVLIDLWEESRDNEGE